jgi:hypothetical protein
VVYQTRVEINEFLIHSLSNQIIERKDEKDNKYEIKIKYLL